MKVLRLSLILAITLTQACKTLKTTSGNKQTNSIALTIFQSGKETPVKNYSETIEIYKKEFSLRFFNKKYDSENKKFYSAQIAAFMEKAEFDKIKEGMLTSDLPCFEPGSGMAPYRSGKYESLIFNNNGSHYAFYENSESKRLNLLEDSGEYPKLEFEINSLFYDNNEVNMTDTELEEFYIAFFIDKDLNGKIDKGELYKLTVRVK
ncbi:hypothetical protein RCC89_06540 [Cytophagaceae bacterium ABcell3]|nr:hypothetical protein RCC89_06540 [Cytophagaceae bacterium ABcell3]